MCELQQLNMSWIEVHITYIPALYHAQHSGCLCVCFQAQFLKKAVDILCQCRQTLRYTYAFAYYLRKNNHTLIFEDNQRDLEMATETLSEYLERDISHSTISDMKIFVQDKSKSALTYVLALAYIQHNLCPSLCILAVACVC